MDNRSGFRSMFERMLRGNNAPIDANGKKTIPARRTAIRGNSKLAEDPGKRSRAMLAGNALQIHIAAHFTMYITHITYGRRPGIKSQITATATPGAQQRDSD
jgi:hypothetical protein